MAARSFEASEYFPFWELVEPARGDIKQADFTDEEIADYERVMTAFKEWQDKIRERIDNGHL